jgi:uncharacterized membrane protein YkoI
MLRWVVFLILPFSVYAQSSVSLEEAAQGIYAQEGGQILKAVQFEEDQKTIYHIRILTSLGKVKTYEIDATTGKIMN